MRTQILICMLPLFAAACSSRDEENLQAWMNKVRRESHPVPLPISRPLVTESVRYEAGDHADPFDVKKISASLSTSGSGIVPDLQRLREPLESYPLDTLRMVGSLRRAGQAVALIQADKLLYQVRKGDHLGQDQGAVVRIDDNGLELEEIVQEAAGTWSKRRVQLSIQEKK